MIRRALLPLASGLILLLGCGGGGGGGTSTPVRDAAAIDADGNATPAADPAY